jgi:hypothetical protein
MPFLSVFVAWSIGCRRVCFLPSLLSLSCSLAHLFSYSIVLFLAFSLSLFAFALALSIHLFLMSFFAATLSL